MPTAKQVVSYEVSSEGGAITVNERFSTLMGGQYVQYNKEHHVHTYWTS